MTAEPAEFPLAAEFRAWRHEDWVALVTEALKGADFEAKLVTRIHDGLRIEPLYRAAEHVAPIAGREAARPWQILQRLEHPDPAIAMEQARQDLEGGASGFAVILSGAI